MPISYCFSPSLPAHPASIKERWIKLKGNLLFFYKINEYGGLNDMLPRKLLLLELFKVKREHNETLPFAFSLGG